MGSSLGVLWLSPKYSGALLILIRLQDQTQCEELQTPASFFSQFPQAKSFQSTHDVSITHSNLCLYFPIFFLPSASSHIVLIYNGLF